MGNSASVHSAEVSFTGPNTITNPGTPLLLLAAPSVDTQPWRIAGTLGAEQEERQINRLAENKEQGGKLDGTRVVYYGLNSTDTAPDTQAKKLAKFGVEASVYRGGLLEWGLLRDVFGDTPYGLVNIGSDRDLLWNSLDFLPEQ